MPSNELDIPVFFSGGGGGFGQRWTSFRCIESNLTYVRAHFNDNDNNNNTYEFFTLLVE